MPHLRNRSVLPKLLKKMKFFPIVALQGARQTGKSVLARDLLPQFHEHLQYFSFDDFGTRKEAERSPRTFLLSKSSASPLVLDEAQKVPEIFDALKFQVDQNRIPGGYVILGSTEFSRLAQIRESLTGRLGKIRLFPLTLKESLNDLATEAAIQQQDVLRYLENGGMPGIFAIRDEEAQSALFQDWLDLVCFRDLNQFKTLKLDGDIAFEILRACAQLEEPTQAGIAKEIKIHSRKVQTHLKALVELYVLQKLDPHPSGTGSPIFLPFDVGLARFLNASLIRRLQIWIMNERMANNAYFEKKRARFYFYRSRAKTMIHLVEDSMNGSLLAIQCTDKENIKKTDAVLMNSFLTKNPHAKGVVLAPLLAPSQIGNTMLIPWQNFISL